MEVLCQKGGGGSAVIRNVGERRLESAESPSVISLYVQTHKHYRLALTFFMPH